MNRECSIVKDLAPLYVEELTGCETNEFIAEHLARCESCRNEIARLRTPTPAPVYEDTAPLKKLNRYLRRRQSLTVIATALAAAVLFILLGAFLTTPEYLSAEDAIINIARSTDTDRIQTVFSEKTADFRLEGPYEHDGTAFYEITAWTTPWHQLFGNSKRNLSCRINFDANTEPAVFYNSNNGEAMIRLYGTPISSGGAIALPRLTLNYYALIAAALLLLTAILYFPLRSRRALWQKLILLPLCYLAAHYLILLTSPDTYSISRSFCLILLLAMTLYGTTYVIFKRIRCKA